MCRSSLTRCSKARKLVNSLMLAKMNRDEKVAFYARRIVMRSVVQALNSWKRYTRRMRKVKRLCDRVLGNGMRDRVGRWRAFVKQAKLARAYVGAFSFSVFLFLGFSFQFCGSCLIVSSSFSSPLPLLSPLAAAALQRVYANRKFRIHVNRLVLRTGAATKIQAFLRSTRAKRLVWYMMRRERSALNIQRVRPPVFCLVCCVILFVCVLFLRFLKVVYGARHAC